MCDTLDLGLSFIVLFSKCAPSARVSHLTDEIMFAHIFTRNNSTGCTHFTISIYTVLFAWPGKSSDWRRSFSWLQPLAQLTAFTSIYNIIKHFFFHLTVLCTQTFGLTAIVMKLCNWLTTCTSLQIFRSLLPLLFFPLSVMLDCVIAHLSTWTQIWLGRESIHAPQCVTQQGHRRDLWSGLLLCVGAAQQVNTERL